MIRVVAPARLHFGLLSLPGAGDKFWPDGHGAPAIPVRRYGGVGLMVEEPALRLRVEPASFWSAEGPLASRALAFAEQFLQESPELSLTPQRLVIEAAPPEHSGFGSGTQLGLTVARALAPSLPVAELARRVGRGRRSALGVHGFEQGGFLVEAGKHSDEGLAPLVTRLPFPESWRIVLARPEMPVRWHGERERQAFQEIAPSYKARASTEALCRLVLLGLVPALIERDLAVFGEALFDFNARAGEAFAAVQGGTYAGPEIAELIEFVRRQGTRGVGQSSWGPTVFAVVAEDEAEGLARALRSRGVTTLVTRAAGTGAQAVVL